MNDWRITFLETGNQATVGDSRPATYIGVDEVFLATYGNGLTDAPLDETIEWLVESGMTGQFMSARACPSYRLVAAEEHGVVHSMQPLCPAHVRINGGFFGFQEKIFST